jgi:hypothetical protein
MQVTGIPAILVIFEILSTISLWSYQVYKVDVFTDKQELCLKCELGWGVRNGLSFISTVKCPITI